MKIGQGEEKLTADAVDNPAIRQNIFAAQENVELPPSTDSDLRNPKGNFAPEIKEEDSIGTN